MRGRDNFMMPSAPTVYTVLLRAVPMFYVLTRCNRNIDGDGRCNARSLEESPLSISMWENE